ncbi:MAG: DEAD/DEAH box helicase [Chitinispirillales bacterium]|nr:DEAD/DEAH box helicase [Chitinispirillales bacterium]
MIYQGLKLDPFQIQAVEAVNRGESVIVAAPTGCGKTVIAEYAVEESVKQGKRAIYTAPIKALSNQKFRDFRKRFGDEAVGIQTGDVTINQDAQLLIMTTEIFRNLILENSGRLNDIYYVIFDEIHYLDDPERGTVWEESIILAPPEIRFMCLSATVPNIRELASWMGAVRETKFTVIEETHRPVPLEHFFFHPKFGFLSIKAIKKKYKNNPAIRKSFQRRKPSSRRIVQFAIREKHVPILYFCFNRRACERNAEQHMQHLDLLNDGEREQVRRLVNELVEQYDIRDYERLNFLRELWESGIAYHHAGILPAAKEIVERLFTAGLIKLLFCTETFALGVNMPASSVIFDELEKFDGVQFNYLMTREYNQMAGRAGRRGMDEVGYVYSQVIPEATDAKELERLLYGNNERINSRFYASYSTILSLYSQFGDAAFDIFRKSLHNFRKGTFSMTKAYQKEEAQIRNRIKFLQAGGFLDGRKLTPKGQLAAAVSGYEIQAAELYFARDFEELSATQLPVVLAALITEEARNRKAEPVSNITLKFAAEKTIRRLRQKEIKHNISNPVREMDFSLAAPVFAWASGCDLAQLAGFGVPEGDLIRVLRMTVQLLRTLRDKIQDPVISDKMHEALELINRSVVDAQAQLEVG